MTEKTKNAIPVTPDLMEEFLASMAEAGRCSSTVSSYRAALKQLYSFLPEDKRLTGETGLAWRESLTEAGASPRTVNHRISVYNRFVLFLGQRQWQTDALRLPERQPPSPALTREEFLALLAAARRLRKERSRLLVLTMGGAGMRLRDLPLVTVGALRKSADIPRLGREPLAIPQPLRDELLDYAERQYIQRGPVFVTREGALMNRSQVWKAIQLLCAAAGVPAEKGNPRHLEEFYRTACRELEEKAREALRLSRESLPYPGEGIVG